MPSAQTSESRAKHDFGAICKSSMRLLQHASCQCVCCPFQRHHHTAKMPGQQCMTTAVLLPSTPTTHSTHTHTHNTRTPCSNTATAAHSRARSTAFTLHMSNFAFPPFYGTPMLTTVSGLHHSLTVHEHRANRAASSPSLPQAASCALPVIALSAPSKEFGQCLRE